MPQQPQVGTIRENPMSSAVLEVFQIPDPSGSATIGKSVTIKGQIISREDLTIEGEVLGSIDVEQHHVTIGPNGRLQADVKAHDVVVLGSINGNIEATERIDIRKQASIVGDVKAARIVTEEGAYIKGSMDTTGAQQADLLHLSSVISNY
jgi:cytoskeletal protein CcmA (bactofilin family)